MKSLLLLASLLTSLAAAVPPAPPDAVIAAEKARCAALLSGDAAALGDLLSDALRYTHSNGRLEDKRTVINGVASKEVRYERFELGQLDARSITPDVVVLTGTIDQRKRSAGKANDARLLFHAVWRNESGSWRLVSLQTVQPPPPAAPTAGVRP